MGAAEKLEFSKELVIKKMEELPSLPDIVYELAQIINDPMCSTTDIERIMSKDVGMTTKVLKLANSAYYAIPGGVSNLARAIGFIGFDTINQLVLSASIIEALDTQVESGFDLNQFWKHTIGVGVAAETIAKFVNDPVPADLFTCGLVHDMGKVAIFNADADYFVALSKFAIEKKLTLYQAEAELGCPMHTEIGQILAEKWALPKKILSVIRHHHEPDPLKRGGLSDDLNRSVDIVFLANLLTHALKFGQSGHLQILGAPNSVMARLMIDPQKDFPILLKEIRTHLDRADDFVKNIGGGNASSEKNGSAQ